MMAMSSKHINVEVPSAILVIRCDSMYKVIERLENVELIQQKQSNIQHGIKIAEYTKHGVRNARASYTSYAYETIMSKLDQYKKAITEGNMIMAKNALVTCNVESNNLF